MKVRQLVDRLSKFDPDAEIMVLDGFNGSGTPRAVNFGPGRRVVTEDDGRVTGDCADLVGQTIVIIGYGCY